MDQKIKTRLILLVLIEIVFLGGASWLLFQDGEFSKKVLEEKKNIHDIELKLANYEKVENEYLKLGGKGETLAQRFTAKDDAVYFIRDIEQAAGEVGLSLEISIYKEPASAKKKTKEQLEQEAAREGELVLLLETEGSFANFMKFLIKVENLKKYIEVRKIDLVKETIKESVPGSEATSRDVLRQKVIVSAK